MQALGERFGEAVGEGLEKDRAVVVELLLELRDLVVAAEPGGHGETADVVPQSCFLGRHEVAE